MVKQPEKKVRLRTTPAPQQGRQSIDQSMRKIFGRTQEDILDQAIRDGNWTVRKAVSALKQHGFAFHGEDMPDGSVRYTAITHESVPMKNMREAFFISSINNTDSTDSYLSHDVFSIVHALLLDAQKRGYPRDEKVDHSREILEEVGRHTGMTAAVTGNKIHISHEQTPELWFDVNPDAKPADVEKRLRRYEKARAKFVAFKNELNGEFAFPENEPFEKVVDAAGTLLKNKRRETERQARQAEQAHKHNGQAPEQEDNGHASNQERSTPAPYEGNGHSLSTPEPTPSVLSPERHNGQSEPQPVVRAETASPPANGKAALRYKAMLRHIATAPASLHPLSEQSQGVTLVLDANILFDLAAPRGDGKGTWLDLLRETAELPNVTIVIPAYIVDWEISRKTSLIADNGQVEKQGPQVKPIGVLNRGVNAIEAFLKSATRVARGEGGRIRIAQTNNGSASNIIVWETEKCREAFDEIRHIRKTIFDKKQQREKFRQKYNGAGYGEQCIEQFVNREIPFHTPVIIVSEDQRYTTRRNYTKSFQNQPVGEAGLEDYINALNGPVLTLNTVMDDIYANEVKLCQERHKEVKPKERLFNCHEHRGKYVSGENAPSLRDFISLGSHFQGKGVSSPSPQEKLEAAQNGHFHTNAKSRVPAELPRMTHYPLGERLRKFVKRVGLDKIDDLVEALNAVRNLPERYNNGPPYEAADVWTILKGERPPDERFALRFVHAIRTAGATGEHPLTWEEKTELYKAFRDQLNLGDIGPLGNGNGQRRA